MSTVTVIKAPRKPKARHKDVVFGAINERLDMLGGLSVGLPEVQPHVERLNELLDELRRSIASKDEADE